jgi:heptosyltransferase-3
MKKKAIVFCCKGLGDGLISFTLSYNLALTGWEVVSFHPFLQGMQPSFPWQKILPFPEGQDLEKALGEADKIFFFYEKSQEMKGPLTLAQSLHRHKTTILNPIATKRKDYPFWEEGRFNGEICFVDNLLQFCRSTLGIKNPVRSAGIIPASQYAFCRNPRRIVIHPKSSREGKNWLFPKYLALAKILLEKGYEPVFIFTKEEKKQTEGHCFSEYIIDDLVDLVGFVYESFAMIGNDSGIGHLASALGLSTITICRSPASIRFWRPAFSHGSCVTPRAWIPNIKVLRLRDKYWKMWISPRRILKDFNRIAL